MPKARNGRRRAVALTAVITAIAGCATPPPPPRQTTVTLLPDDDGRVGAVTVSAAGSVHPLRTAYSALTAIEGAKEAITHREQNRQAIEAMHADLLRAQPPRPASFTLHFVLDSTALTAESEALLKEVIAAAKARTPTEVSVLGHADESGTPERNLRLSAERAQLVADLLRRTAPSLGSIEVQYFGDSAPLIPTAGRKAEPRNRRVEISIL